MDNYKRQKIKARADELRKEARVDSLPIDPFAIARHLEISVEAKPRTMAGASGWLIKSGDNFGILYATHIGNEGFQRFSVAHELGHYWLEGHPEHIFSDSLEHASRAGFGSVDPIEQEADYFAACLLMPEALCRAHVTKSSDGLAGVQSLATLCKASLEAAAIRYAEISGVHTAAVISSNKKIEYCMPGSLLKQFHGSQHPKRGTKPPVDSATERLLDDIGLINACCEDSDTSTAAMWFSCSSRKGIVEEAIGLGRYGKVLTILTLENADEDEEDDDETEVPRFRR